MTIALSNTKHFGAGLELFAARLFQKREVIGTYFETLVYHGLSFQGTRGRFYADRVLKMNVTLFSKYALEIQRQERRFGRVTEQLRYTRALCVVSASFCACGFINDFRYTEEIEESNQYDKSLMATTRLPNVQ